jgi:hypothetical protein
MPMEPDEIVAKICAFLSRIGIPYEEAEVPEDTFLPGLEIQNGAVRIDRARLTYPGDILHEAGHIALTEPSLRSQVGQEMLSAQHPAQSEEIGVILWTYLAAREIGLPPEVVFHAAGYKDQGSWLSDQFKSGNYIGAPLLNWMGITEPGKAGDPPIVKSWLRVSGS